MSGQNTPDPHTFTQTDIREVEDALKKSMSREYLIAKQDDSETIETKTQVIYKKRRWWIPSYELFIFVYLGGFLAMYAGGETTFTGLISLFVQTKDLTDITGGGYLLSGMYVCFTLGR
jgi:fucose permease